jgi:CheY-like chemotaxis protein
VVGLPSERRRILVVEDNAVNQMVAVGLLESMGYEADTADDGVLALEALAAADYDLVLMDVQMPRLDGYATTREIRAREGAGARLPVVAMTAAAVEGERERCLAAGMDDFLTKPVDPEALTAVLATRLGRGRSLPARRLGSAPAPAPAAEGLDLERLDMLRDMGDGDTSYLDRAIGRFVAGSSELLEAIRSAVDDADVAALQQAAHRLAGSAGNLGVVAVATLARELEHLADAGSARPADGAVERLAATLERGRAAVLAYRESYRPDGLLA